MRLEASVFYKIISIFIPFIETKGIESEGLLYYNLRIDMETHGMMKQRHCMMGALIQQGWGPFYMGVYVLVHGIRKRKGKGLIAQ